MTQSASPSYLTYNQILQGVEYTRSLSTGWKAPLRIRRLSEDEAQDIRDRFHIIVEGDHLPPPIIDFAHMKLPPAVRLNNTP